MAYLHVDALKESENTLTTACNDNFWLLLSSNFVVSCSHRVFSVCSQYFKVSALLYRQLASLYFSNFPSPRSGPLAPRTTPKACHLSFFSAGSALLLVAALEINAIKGKTGPMTSVTGVIHCGIGLMAVLLVLIEFV